MNGCIYLCKELQKFFKRRDTMHKNQAHLNNDAAKHSYQNACIIVHTYKRHCYRVCKSHMNDSKSSRHSFVTIYLINHRTVSQNSVFMSNDLSYRCNSGETNVLWASQKLIPSLID